MARYAFQKACFFPHKARENNCATRERHENMQLFSPFGAVQSVSHLERLCPICIPQSEFQLVGTTTW